MTEIEKIEYTKRFVDKLASGINPLDDTPIPDGDLLNNVRISRCMFYVSDILGKVISNNGFTKRTSDKDKPPFYITSEQLAQFEFSQEPIGVSEITKRINSLIDENVMKKLKVTSITEWLVDIDMLYNEIIGNKKHKRVTQRGKSLGISEQIFQGQYGEYKKLLYNEAAQRFIIDNIQAVIEKNNS
ncbi:MAG: hypothetical protein ACI4RF_08795 [Eubacterium sp.]